MSLEISFSQPPHYQSEAIPAPLSGSEYTVFETGLDASNFEYTFNTFLFIHRSPNHSFRYQFWHSPRNLRLSELRINTVGLKQQISQPAVFSYMI